MTTGLGVHAGGAHVEHVDFNDLLTLYLPPPPGTWSSTFDALWDADTPGLDALCDAAQLHGLTDPVLLGEDGSVREGLRLLAVAERLALASVPVRRTR